MRRFAAAAVGAAALSATLFATAGTASASATAVQVTNPGGDGGVSVSARAAAAGTSANGKMHTFKLPGVHGASAWGDWYWTKSNGRSFVVIDYFLKKTTKDHKSAAICYDLTSPAVQLHNRCMVSPLGYGKTAHIRWNMGTWNQDKLYVRTAVGTLNKQHNFFTVTAAGAWLKLH